MVHEPPNNLHRRCVVILNLVKVPFIERQEWRVWIPEQNWRVGGNDELCIFVLPENVMEQYQKSQLALRRECRLRLIQQEQAVALELEFKECEERLPVRTSMKTLAVVVFI